MIRVSPYNIIRVSLFTPQFGHRLQALRFEDHIQPLHEEVVHLCPLLKRQLAQLLVDRDRAISLLRHDLGLR